MSKTTTNLLLMLITIVAGTYFFITCCSECNNVIKEPTKQNVIIDEPNATTYGFLNKGEKHNYTTVYNYTLSTSSNNFLLRIGTQLTHCHSELQFYLRNNKSKILYKTGFYISEVNKVKTT